MLEIDLIQTRGFKNVSESGKTTGFELHIRTPYYRGMWASLLEGADVTVDGETISREKIQWTISGATYSLAELAASKDVRWPFDEAAVLTAPKPGGLAVGVHDVHVCLRFRASYMPPDMGPWITNAERKLAITR